MINEIDICLPAFIDEHPELHHYTSIASLEAIAGSGTLLATHFLGLNDATEVVHLRAPLVAEMTILARQAVDRRSARDANFRLRVVAGGGADAVARGVVGDLVDAFYKVAFTDQDETALAPPFITSFCSHATDEAYEREHGLLSQWRGYGGNEGICLVFDTAGLVEALRSEQSAYDWVHLSLTTAKYATDPPRLAEMFPALVAEFGGAVAAAFEPGGLDEIVARLGFTFLTGATCYKHRAFAEEREVRVVGLITTQRVVDYAASHVPGLVRPPLKAVRTMDRGGRQIQRVALFEGLGLTLPIRRVIVGPAGEQASIAARVQAALPAVPVTLSATPLV